MCMQNIVVTQHNQEQRQERIHTLITLYSHYDHDQATPHHVTLSR